MRDFVVHSLLENILLRDCCNLSLVSDTKNELNLNFSAFITLLHCCYYYYSLMVRLFSAYGLVLVSAYLFFQSILWVNCFPLLTFNVVASAISIDFPKYDYFNYHFYQSALLLPLVILPLLAVHVHVHVTVNVIVLTVIFVNVWLVFLIFIWQLMDWDYWWHLCSAIVLVWYLRAWSWNFRSYQCTWPWDHSRLINHWHYRIDHRCSIFPLWYFRISRQTLRIWSIWLRTCATILL